MNKTATTPHTSVTVDAFDLAHRCREAIRGKFFLQNACIDVSHLFERTAFHLGLQAKRVVCQALAFTPLWREAMDAGIDMKTKYDVPGYWSVGVGFCQMPGDFIGRVDRQRNRFVGHVICLIDDHLVDANSDQLSRPKQGMPIQSPIVFKLEEAQLSKNVVGIILPNDMEVEYRLHPDIPVPNTKYNKLIERLAKNLAAETKEAVIKEKG